jgi:hypothetical protein
MSALGRRQFLALNGAAMFAASREWKAGPVRLILPTVSDRRILVKAAFAEPQARAALRIGGERTPGVRADSRGKYWWFDRGGLEPGREYSLQLTGARGQALGDPWPLKTFPAPQDSPRQLRVLLYTCAGGDERARIPNGTKIFLSLAMRQALLDRALSFAPDAVIANGDHIYWDLWQTGSAARYGDVAREVGEFQRDLPVEGTPNEAVLDRVVEAQITALYGTRFRSTPVFAPFDDHDYFENDDALPTRVTFPPDPFMLALGRAVRRWAIPEFLPDPARPAGLLGASAPDSPRGTAETYGTLRYGKLAEFLIYDCRRGMRLDGPTGVFVQREAEAWLAARMAAADTSHLIHVPSTPPGWSAGKWGEWYPDVLDASGKLTTAIPKPFWQEGWAAQHDRILAAAAAMKDRIPLFVSGDLHAIGEARILRAGKRDLRRNPVVAMLPGPISTSGPGWPSAFRGTRALPTAHCEVDERVPAIEENGFLILDLTPEVISARFFRWTPAAGDASLLRPFREITLKR